MVLEHVRRLDNVIVNADQNHVVFIHASTPSRSGPRSCLAAILTRRRLRGSCLDSFSLRSSLVPRCDPHSSSPSGFMPVPSVDAPAPCMWTSVFLYLRKLPSHPAKINVRTRPHGLQAAPLPRDGHRRDRHV